MLEEMAVMKLNDDVICGMELMIGDKSTSAEVKRMALAGIPCAEIFLNGVITLVFDSFANW